MKVFWLLLLSFLWLLIESSKYHQSDYTVKLDRIELADYNRSYIQNGSCGFVHYNRTFRAANASGLLLKDLSMNMKAEFQLYKFRSNEYRFFPLTMELKVCNELQRDNFGLRESLQNSVNFRLLCPFKKGFYRMTYGKINFANFPPYIPGGQYKAEVKVLVDNSNLLFEVHFYAHIEEILKLWEH